MMIAPCQILVAGELMADVELVETLLRADFDDIGITNSLDRAAAEFDERRPAVLILAFNTLEKAQAYYLGLFRRSAIIHTHAHSCLLLCNRNELQRVYQLCRKNHFDNYVLFWPMADEPCRLRMEVHNALKQVARTETGIPAARALMQNVRHVASLERRLQEDLAAGGRHVDAVAKAAERAREEVAIAIEGFSRSLEDGDKPGSVEIRDPTGFRREVDRLKKDGLGHAIGAVTAAAQPFTAWKQSLNNDIEAHAASTQSLEALTESARPQILLVDDDPFQHRLLRKLLKDCDLDLQFATSAIDAFARLRRQRPQLILMDFGLPDMDGIETTVRLKSIERLASIPIVMITGHSEKDVVMKSLDAGARDFLVKPLSRSVLVEKLAHYLGEIGIA